MLSDYFKLIYFYFGWIWTEFHKLTSHTEIQDEQK